MVLVVLAFFVFFGIFFVFVSVFVYFRFSMYFNISICIFLLFSDLILCFLLIAYGFRCIFQKMAQNT